MDVLAGRRAGGPDLLKLKLTPINDPEEDGA
jgi:hypothetical protein